MDNHRPAYENVIMGSPARPSLHPIHRWATALVLSVVGSGSGIAAAQPAPDSVKCESDALCINRVERAEICARDGNLNGAILLYKLAYRERPDPRLLYHLGRMYRKQGQFAEATDAYKEFLSKPGQDEESRRKAQAFLSQREREDLGPGPSLTKETPVKPKRDKSLLITSGIFMGLGALQVVVGGTLLGLGADDPFLNLGLAGVTGHGGLSVLIGIPILVVVSRASSVCS